MKRNVVLIGMSGAGKSTIGVLLAKALGSGFIDTDIIIQQAEGRTLQSIIDDDGIGYFLEAERKAICALAASDCVIATGGSVVYSACAMQALKENGLIVYLEVPFGELERRLTNIVSRGIVMGPGETLREVFLEREPLYKSYADITVCCADASIEQCVAATRTQLEEATI